jgi:hypothetical protein
MDPIEKLERTREARRRLQVQRHRVGVLRTRVVAVSLISFVLLWGVVFARLATGNDPVLGASTPAPHSSSAAAREAIEIEPEPEPAPVTTSQS